MTLDFSNKNIPILITGYNRPNYLKSVLDRINSLGYSNIWIALDGPKSYDKNDANRTNECKLLLKLYDFYDINKCLIQETNLGCKYGMATAIGWFFANNDMGIIIEDDLEFNHNFLFFCESALRKFKNDYSVGSITGYQPLDLDAVVSKKGFSHVVHPFFSVWGWASWSDRWLEYDVEMKKWKSALNLLRLIKSTHGKHLRYWIRRFEDFENGKVDSWDFQFLFSHFMKNWKVVAPINNLVGNVGFGETATHTKKSRVVQPISMLNQTSDLEYPFIANRNFIKLYLQEQFNLK